MNSGLPDSLPNFIYHTGKIAELRYGVDAAIKEVEGFIGRIRQVTASPAVLMWTYSEAGEYYGTIGKTSLAYKAHVNAYNYCLQKPKRTGSELAFSQNNLGTYAQRLGNLNLSQFHTREAIRHSLSDPAPEPETLYRAYNNLGSIMYYSSKLDSALHFFDLALETLKKTPPNNTNKYYRPAIIYNNHAGIYGIQGKSTDAIAAMKTCITNLKYFIASKENPTKQSAAVSFQFEAVDNLGGIYKQIGDYRQAHDLLSYSYSQKKLHLTPDDPGIFISEILLGQIYYAMKEFDKAQKYLTNGLDLISKADGDYLFWQADACNTLALLHDVKGEEADAAIYYEKADALYEQSLQGSYDNIYLEFLANAGLFYAQNKLLPKALAKANKAYNYVVRTEGTASLLHFHQLLNFAEIHFASGDHKKAIEYSEQSLAVVNGIIKTSTTLLDSIHIELKKPRAILLRERSTYELLAVKDINSLTVILENLKRALAIVEKRKSVLQSSEDISLLMADQRDLLEFIKKITLDLYLITRSQKHADELVSLHESALYSRIRSRLDKSGTAAFAHLPASITQK
ncbi:MAG TPA: hypothetical protein VEB42_17205, partial [Chitinophagaceae bacterium]|nr:hypothetical protein [Chitinophagaceae bacterium]